MKKYLFTVGIVLLAIVSVFSQNLTKQCTPGSFYYSCGAAAAHQSEQGPWLDLVINGNQNSWYQGYGVESASWKEYDNGTAVLTSRLYQIINKTNVKFDLHLTFSNKGAGTPHGAGDGWHCLPNSTNDWYYYRAATGSITGVAGTHVQGVAFTATLVGGSALQIGTGGSINSTSKYGMSAWLNLTQTGGHNICWKKGGTDLYYDLNNCTNIAPPVTCNNLTSGGKIGDDQTGCSPYAANTINNITLPSGGDASKAIEYVWLKTTDVNGPTNLPTCDANGNVSLKSWSMIAGANGHAYNPGTVSQTTWYLRCSRRVGCPCYYGESNLVKITITGACGTTGGGSCPNLVNNGNFGAGFIGFTSEIRRNTFADCGNGGSIDVVSNSNVWGFPSCGDKDGNGKFLLIDFPAGDIWQKIWQQTVSVQTNTNYTFTFWAQSVHHENPAKLIAVINNQMFTQLTLPTTTCQWVKYEVQWNSGNNTTANLMIKNNNAECHGNDFGIDAITFNCNGGTTPPTVPNCAAAVTASNNSPKCIGQNIQLSANGTSTSTGTTGGTTLGSELVVNGNFNAGNTGFTSELIYKAWDGGCDNYAVTSTPQNDWKWPAPCSDHTGNGGKMLLFDTPSGDAWKVHWKQCINVQPNTNYEFSYWATSLYSGNSARLYTVINNMNAGNVSGVTTVGSTTCQWQKITFTWNSGSATQACIMLKNENGDCHGNDFAIDDVSFKPVIVNNPTTCTPSYAWTGPNGYTSNEQNPIVTVSGAYKVTYKDKFCCTATATTNVTTSSAATAAITGNTSVCAGAKTTLTATGGSTYLWSNGATTASITVGAGAYSVTVSNAAGCTGTASATVNTSAALVTAITGNTSVCAGAKTTLTAAGGGTYLWSNGATTSSISVGAGTYSVTVSNAAGCTGTASVVVNTRNFTTAITGTTIVCRGKTTILTATGGGTYLWSNGATTSSITVGAGTYSVVVTNAEGCTASASSTVTESAIPQQVSITGKLITCNGGTTTLTANTIGSYTWSNGATTKTITVGAGTYSVTVSNDAGCAATANATVTNSTLAVAITGEPTVCQNATTTLTATGGSTYLWSNGATTSSITVGAGTYSVTATNVAGCTATSSITVTSKNCNTSSIGNFVFCDKNGNGVQDAGEPGIAGVVVTLTGTNASGQAVNLTATTDANGKYLFANLQAGTYKVTFAKPTGFVTTGTDKGGNDATDSDADATTGMTANIILGASENNTSVDAGYYQLSSIGDFVFEDKDNDGVQDAGEPGIAGVTVTLTGTAGDGTPVTLTTTTSPTGAYVFGNLKPGTYTLNFGKPTGFNPSPKNQGGNPATDSDIDASGNVTVTLPSGTNNTTVDAGFNKPVSANASIGNFVFCDKNGNGVQDAGEPGIAGVVVTLTGTNASGQAVNLTATTDANGKYVFANLQAGIYKVAFAKPTGFVTTGADKGGNDATDSDADATTGMTANIILGASENNTSVDAGYYQLSSIGDFVFEDKDNDGVQDAGEPGIAGVTVTLTGTAGDGTPVTLTTTTSPTGAYVFGNLKPGTYTLNFGKPTGFNPSPKNQGGNPATDSDIDASGNVTVTLPSGTNNTTVDAGFNKPVSANASIGNFVFCDKNGNGVQDAGEPGIAGVVVTLTGTNASGQAVNLTATTDANGKYVFANLQAGIYKVAFAKPTGFVTTGADKGGNDATDSDADATTGMTANIILGASENNTSVDAGYYQLSSIGDFVFEDKDNDGVQDAGEPGIAGVTVVLNGLVNNIPITQVTTTDANGKYKFINLLPGSYTLTFQKPTGYTASPQDQGADDTADSDANPTTGVTAPIVLSSGQVITTIDAGFSLPSVNITIGDFVFLDCNKNKIQDGDAGVANVTVKLKNAAGAVVATTTTNAAGKYSFTVPAGSYNVCFAMPTTSTGLTFVTKDQGTNDAIDSDVNAAGETGLINFTATNNTIDAGISDIIAPVLNTIPADATVSCNAIPAVPANIMATDNCDPAPTVMFSSTTIPLASTGQYLLKRTWTAVDKCGNKSTKTWTLCVKDEVAPVITNFPKDVTVECNAIPAVANPTITDNCDNNVSVDYTQTIIPGDCPDSYKIKRSWTAKDAAGNACGHVQYICVQDTKAPVITGVPADVTVKCGDPIPFPPAPGFVKGTDNCDAYVTLTFSEIYYAGNCNGKSQIRCQWTAVDNCGNISAKIWTITLESGAAVSLVKNTQNSATVIAPIAINRELITEGKVLYSPENIQVFPNPTYGQVTVNLGVVEASRLVVINEIGQIVQTITNPSNQVSLDLSNNRKGFYTLQVFTTQGVLAKKLIIIE